MKHLDPIMVRVALVWLGWTEGDLNRAIGRSERRRVLGRRATLADPELVLPAEVDVGEVLATAGVPLAWLQPDKERRQELRRHLPELAAWLRGGPVPVALLGEFAATCGHAELRAHVRNRKCTACSTGKGKPPTLPVLRNVLTTEALMGAATAAKEQGLRGQARWEYIERVTGVRASTCQREAYRRGFLVRRESES